MSLQSTVADGDSDEKVDGQKNVNVTSDDVIDSDCPICLQKLLHPVILPCNHVFCYLCCKGEGMKRKRCAMCRSEIPPDYFFKPTLLDPKVASEKEAKSKVEAKSLDDGYQWFYEGRNGWWQYDERSSVEIEQHYQDGNTSAEMLIAGSLYVIDFEQMRQYRTNYPGKFRRIKRDLYTIPIKGIAGLRIKSDKSNTTPSTSESSALSDRPQAEGNETVNPDQARGGGSSAVKLSSQSGVQGIIDNEDIATQGASNLDKLNSNENPDVSNGTSDVVTTSMDFVQNKTSRRKAQGDSESETSLSAQNERSSARGDRNAARSVRTVMINPNDSSRVLADITQGHPNPIASSSRHRLCANQDSMNEPISSTGDIDEELNVQNRELNNFDEASAASSDIYPIAFHSTQPNNPIYASAITTHYDRSQENGNVQFGVHSDNFSPLSVHVDSATPGESAIGRVNVEAVQPRRRTRARSDRTE